VKLTQQKTERTRRAAG